MADHIDPRYIDASEGEIYGASAEDIEIPFDLKAKDFLDFAGDDLRGNSIRDTVNALGNIKRSIDCLFDSLLFMLNFLEESKRGRWTFPEKMNFLSEIGIITPYILSRINSARNLLEHEFRKPNRKDVEMAYDVAILLYYATIRFTRRFISIVDMEVQYKKVWKALRMTIGREERDIEVSIDKQSISVAWNERPEDYKQWLRILYQALSLYG